MKDRTENGIGAEGQPLDWNFMPWNFIEKSIRKLRQRIFRATREQKWNKVRSLMKLMLRSYFNLLVSVRRVTQSNKGKNTAGVDKELALTPQSRMRLVRSMGAHKVWTAKPTRRVYIPKPGKPGQERPLGIPTIRNRVAQAIVKNALEPSWEARFEKNSYGFRPGRSIHDAMSQCWLLLSGNKRRPWILDADLKSAFDRIDHNELLKTIGKVPGRELIKQWLAAGYVESEILHATDSGAPQGGVISPLLLNIALHGMEQQIGKAFGVVRYADDFFVCAKQHEDLETVRNNLEQWLRPKGLTLHPEKTRVVHVDDGFNFLGFSIRRYGGACLIKPQKEKVLAFLAEQRKWLNQHKQIAAENVISHLNPILRGWTNNYKHVVSSRTFSYVAFQLWNMLWKWCLRRHPKKGKKWVIKKYFRRHNNIAWTFYAQRGGRTFYLFDVLAVPIVRHIKIKGAASPDDPSLAAYWLERRERRQRQTKVTQKALPPNAGSDARAV